MHTRSKQIQRIIIHLEIIAYCEVYVDGKDRKYTSDRTWQWEAKCLVEGKFGKWQVGLTVWFLVLYLVFLLCDRVARRHFASNWGQCNSASHQKQALPGLLIVSVHLSTFFHIISRMAVHCSTQDLTNRCYLIPVIDIHVSRLNRQSSFV